jgi:hypothetical protein
MEGFRKESGRATVMACHAYDEPAIMQLIRELVPEMQAPATARADNVVPFEAKSKV